MLTKIKQQWEKFLSIRSYIKKSILVGIFEIVGITFMFGTLHIMFNLSADYPAPNIFGIMANFYLMYAATNCGLFLIGIYLRWTVHIKNIEEHIIVIFGIINSIFYIANILINPYMPLTVLIFFLVGAMLIVRFLQINKDIKNMY